MKIDLTEFVMLDRFSTRQIAWFTAGCFMVAGAMLIMSRWEETPSEATDAAEQLMLRSKDAFDSSLTEPDAQLPKVKIKIKF